MASQRIINFCFTLNNYTDEDIEKLNKFEYYSYLIYGKEKGENETPHLQGYCELSQQLSFKSLKKLLGHKYHIEKRRGSQQQAIVYCQKDGDYYEFGTKKEQGKRNDLSHLKEMVKDKYPLIQIVDQCINFQQIRFVEKIFEFQPLSTEYKKKTVYWFHGPTGTGKTKTAYEIIKSSEEDFWRCTTTGSQWFNGYYGQPIALLDEVRAKNWTYSTLLEILDGYEIRLPIKGSFTIWKPHTVIITSSKSPEDCYRGQLEFGDGHIDQLLRRITEIREFFPEPEHIVPEMFRNVNQ